MIRGRMYVKDEVAKPWNIPIIDDDDLLIFGYFARFVFLVSLQNLI